MGTQGGTDRGVDKKVIIEALINDEIQFTKHGFQQMIDRKLVRADLANIGRTCVAFKWQDDKKTYFVAGYDTKGKGAALSCKIEGAVVIITVMKRHLTQKEKAGK
ncbi:MAG: hypothetical protein RJB38_523 [Pseudomonadota bacterium]|jgi:hypothetical protein